jgi:hypothetical protein
MSSTRIAIEAAPTWRHSAPDEPGAGTPKDIIRGLVLAAGGVTEPQAALLLRVIDNLELIERREGPAAAIAAAHRIRAIWLADCAD